jgi:hypothetical protein
MYAYSLSRREGRRWSEVRVTGVGPKYVTVIAAERYEDFLADPQANRWWTRKFLIEDQFEGPRDTRTGYGARVATHEQVEYEVRDQAARAYLNDTLGLVVKGSDSPLNDPDKLIAFTDFLRASALDILPPEAQAAVDG